MHPNTKHGLYYHPLYRVWSGIKKRCRTDARPKDFKYYGAQGVSMCEEWTNNFNAFFDWAMLNGWKKGLHIDRREQTGNYCPDNCRIVTRLVNANNRRDNIILVLGDLSKTLPEWSRATGISQRNLRSRLELGWTLQKALSTPVKSRLK